MDHVRIGTLGAARITPSALVRPARRIPEVEVLAVAARDPDRARRFADRHRIPVVHAGYADLLADPEIDAIYNPLPNALHAEWTLAALAAGKHVLCEKPLTANADEAIAVAGEAERSGLTVMEGFHYRYHPYADRLRELIETGTVGRVRHVATWMCVPIPLRSNIRYQYRLGGGATMDCGCYAIHALRLLAGAEPQVERARALLAGPEVDRAMSASFRFPDGTTGEMTCSLWSARLLKIAAKVTGERGEIRAFNYVLPNALSWISVRTADRSWRERVRGEATYVRQLRAFAAGVLRGEPVQTPASESIRNMQVIDAVYRAAGLRPRGTPG
jgi:predicted dehydrogenase